MRSPDPDYEEKRQYAAERLEEARTDPDVTLLYLDECGYEKVPTLNPRLRGEGREAADRCPIAELQPADARCGLPECHYRDGTRSPGQGDRPTGLARSLSGGR